MGRPEALERLAAARLYVVSPDGDPAQAGMVLLDALEGGADVVQLRNKSAEKGLLLGVARGLAAEARRLGALLIVNDHVDLAILAGADGVHLGQDDLPVEEARRLWPDGLIGCSTHAPAQARAAVERGADYLGVGPVHATPTKPGRAAVGLEYVREAAAAGLGIPWFAIGGIDARNLDGVLAAGATRVAVVRAVADAPDRVAATRELRARVTAPGGVPVA